MVGADDWCRTLLGMEIMITLLWLLGLVACLILLGRILQGRRAESTLDEPCCLKYRLFPNPLESLQQRRRTRKQHIVFKHLSRLD